MKVRHPELVLAAATAVCLPMVPGLLAGEIGASTAGERFLVALVVCWVLGSLLSWVIGTYGEQARKKQLERLLGDREDRHPTHPMGPADPVRADE
jgi:membrane protein YqaA with SNARE-associated domain